MEDFTGKVAVVTGAASGIGKGMAERCARLGMKVVLADVDETGLMKVEKRLRAKGAQVLSIVTDVSIPDDMEKLAAETMDAFGAVHLLVNNAGVVGGGTSWESTAADWEWVMGVNLLGVVNSLRSFVPILLRQKEESHVVNNASATGLVSYSLSAPYQASKHGVVSLSEHLHYSLRERAENIGVSVLCSAWVATRILNSGRNRPDDLANSAKENSANRKGMQPYGARVREAVRDAMPVEEVVDCVFGAIESGEFYIVPHPELTEPLVRSRMEGILGSRTLPDADIDELLFLGD